MAQTQGAEAVLEELDFAPVCDVKDFPESRLGPEGIIFGQGIQCVEPARWRATCTGCDGEHLVCSGHRNVLFSSVDVVVCEYCRKAGLASRVFRIQELGS